MSLLTNLAKGVTTAALSANPVTLGLGLVGAATHGRAGIDLTPGYSATNVIRTQYNQAFNKGAGGGSTAKKSGGGSASPQSGPYTAGDGGGVSAAQQQAAAAAKYDQSIRNTQAAFDRLQTSQDAGYSNALTAYNQAVNQLNQDKANYQQTYSKNVGQTKQDYVSAKNTIGSNAGNSLNSLLRLLGQHGAGGSSAALYAAPQAVTRQATLQRNDASGTYGKNMQALDTGWGNYLNSYNQNLNALGIKKQNDINSSLAGVYGERASTLQALGQLFGQKASAVGGDPTGASQPYLDQANRYLNDAARLGKAVPVPQVAPAVYTAPDLASYTTNPNATPTVQGDTQTTDYTSPYLAALLGKKTTPNTAAIGG